MERSDHDENRGDGSLSQLQIPLRNVSRRRLRNRTDPFLVVCRCFSVVTCISSILCFVVNILSAIRSFKNGYDVFDGIFRFYAVLIAGFVVLVETEWGFIIKLWKMLEYCAGRGMLQIFGEDQKLIFLQNLAAYLLLACGFIYIFSGILCIASLKRSRQKKEVSRQQAVKDLEELERRREELEQLLLLEGG